MILLWHIIYLNNDLSGKASRSYIFVEYIEDGNYHNLPANWNELLIKVLLDSSYSVIIPIASSMVQSITIFVKGGHYSADNFNSAVTVEVSLTKIRLMEVKYNGVVVANRMSIFAR